MKRMEAMEEAIKALRSDVAVLKCTVRGLKSVLDYSDTGPFPTTPDEQVRQSRFFAALLNYLGREYTAPEDPRLILK